MVEDAVGGASPRPASHDNLSKVREYDRERVLTRVSHVRNRVGLVGRARVFSLVPPPPRRTTLARLGLAPHRSGGGPVAHGPWPARDAARVLTPPATTASRAHTDVRPIMLFATRLELIIFVDQYFF